MFRHFEPPTRMFESLLLFCQIASQKTKMPAIEQALLLSQRRRDYLAVIPFGGSVKPVEDRASSFLGRLFFVVRSGRR